MLQDSCSSIISVSGWAVFAITAFEITQIFVTTPTNSIDEYRLFFKYSNSLSEPKVFFSKSKSDSLTECDTFP